MQALGPPRLPKRRARPLLLSASLCPRCGSVLAVLPSSCGICSALVCPRPPQAPMIKSSSLTRACPPPSPAAEGE